MTSEQRENFEKAFRAGFGSIRMKCDCGVTYYCGEEPGFGGGELEKVDADVKAIELPHQPSGIKVGDGWYVMDCDCWHAQAEQIVEFLESNGKAICNFYRLEKERKQREADNAPVV